jgi:hypothetical protein
MILHPNPDNKRTRKSTLQWSRRTVEFAGLLRFGLLNWVDTNPFDNYQWVLEEKQAEGWKQLATLDYLQVGGMLTGDRDAW